MKFSGKAKPIKKQKVKPQSASSTSPLRPLPAPFSVPPPPYNPVLNHPSPSVAPNQILGRHHTRSATCGGERALTMMTWRRSALSVVTQPRMLHSALPRANVCTVIAVGVAGCWGAAGTCRMELALDDVAQVADEWLSHQN